MPIQSSSHCWCPDLPWALQVSSTLLTVLLRGGVQLRSVLLTFKTLTLSTVILWFLHEGTCWSFVTTWLGMRWHHVGISCFMTIRIATLQP